jgi:hypothetical protein
VKDVVTNLEWQQAASTTTANSSSAAAACDALSLAGRDDWRLPTAIELFSLVDPGLDDPSISVDFPGIPVAGAGWFWTSSGVAGDATGKRWAVQFRQSGGYSDAFGGATGCSYRCVAADAVAAKPQRYVVAGGIVTDQYTGLAWQQAPAADTLTFIAATDACAHLAVAGVDGWRAPSMNELETLVDRRAAAPVIDAAAFPGAVAGEYWTSQLVAGTAGFAWSVSFATGHSMRVDDGELKPVRCVR